MTDWFIVGKKFFLTWVLWGFVVAATALQVSHGMDTIFVPLMGTITIGSLLTAAINAVKHSEWWAKMMK